MADQGLVKETACAVVDKLKAGDVTPLDLLDVLERRIAEVDGKVNALPTLCFDRARIHAKTLMKKPAAERGLLVEVDGEGSMDEVFDRIVRALS